MSSTVDAATSIAQQMRKSGQSRTWRKVTTILSAYDAYRLTEGLRERMARDFAAAGLELAPSIQDVTRDARVRISLSDATAGTDATELPSNALPASVTIWARAALGWIKVPSVAASPGMVIVDVDLSSGDRHEDLVRILPGYLPGLSSEAVEDLIKPDPRASFKITAPGAPASRASLFVARVEDGETVSTDKSLLLSMSLVEFAVGDDWLVIARHAPDTYLGGTAADSGQKAATADRYMHSLLEYGLGTETTPQEAALAVVNHGVDSFGRTRDVLASYLESWRTDFAKGSRDKTLLSDLQATLPIVVYALEPLRKPNVARWAAGRPPVAKDLSDQVARNYEALQDLQGTVAAAVGQADQAKNEDYQRSLATLAAVFLAPALVASIFGANNMLEDSPWDLVWLLLAMILAGGVTQYFISKRFGPRRPTTPAGRPRVTAADLPGDGQATASRVRSPQHTPSPARQSR